MRTITKVLAMLAILLPTQVHSKPYEIKSVSDIPVELSLLTTLYFETHDFTVAVGYEKNRRLSHKLRKLYSEGYIIQNIVMSYYMIRSFNELHGLPTDTCKQPKWVKLVVVSPKTMYYSKLFEQVRKRHNGFVKVNGAYYENSNDMVVTTLNKRDQLIVLQHELAHYWWDVMCLDATYYSDSEQYAQDYEKFVVKFNKWYRKEITIRL